MKAIRAIPAIIGLGLLTACSSPGDLVTRTDAPDGPLFQAQSPYQAQEVLVRKSYTVNEVNVSVPNVLVVSEANTYKPRADIVWREDPLGDRHQQVATIVQDALVDGVTGMEGERAVVLQVQVIKFHALTERTRYSIGGTHDIHFALTVLDAQTGEVVEPMRVIETELTAFGGRMAIEAERQGQTQKVRISAHLKNLIHQKLTAPREIVVAQQTQ